MKKLLIRLLNTAVLSMAILSTALLSTGAFATTPATQKPAHDSHQHEVHPAKKPPAKKAPLKSANNHQQGEKLHDLKCITCHKNDVYTRKNRTVKSLAALQSQVNNCMKGAARAQWTQPQTTSVVDFLNDRYYKF
ncbi:hypothetical protein MNBD_GAMMA10-1851 [hydrothermal vent metagenome]|uniref:Cytochrome c domain-containing protein n=1 Tax=hydrothermal vent metagenome TaxID=652676 RepID=A0A3B0Y4J9_9ZZZZ